jgi:hypothetical protein
VWFTCDIYCIISHIYIYIYIENIFVPFIVEQGEWIQLFSTLLSHAAYKNYSPSQFTDYINSSANKYSKLLSEEEIQIISNFWNSEYHKIHSQLISESNFTSSLSEKRGGLKWRIDQLTNPDDLNETVETVAIVELNTTKEKKVVFEVDKPTLFYMVEQLQEIQNRINSLSI